MTNRLHPLSTGNAAKAKPSKYSTDQVSLGKLSFKQRLESYYSIVQPDLLSCPVKWGQRFDQIWDKFGGTAEGEQLLAAKLLKKYGTTAIPFRTVVSSNTDDNTSSSRRQTLLKPKVAQHPNEWYELNENERNSGCINFLSDRFDPVAALRRDAREVEELNLFIREVPMLDRVDQFSSFLPNCDPLYRSKSNNNNKSTTNKKLNIGMSDLNSQTATSKATNSIFRHVPICFVDTVKWHETGPYSLLYDALVHQQRIRVLVRYVNSIRGTLTGYVTAFDQHMNILLQDVDEQYSPRRISNEDDCENNRNQAVESLSNGQAELQRRIGCVSRARRSGFEKSSQQDSKSSWTLRQRHMSQIMVRGDIVVLIYKASEERSAWSATTTQSIGDTTTAKPTSRPDLETPLEGRIGTPGSFVCPEKQQHNRKYGFNRKDRDRTFVNCKSNYKSNF